MDVGGSTTCAVCHSTTVPAPFLCSRCRSTRYCGVEHQKAHWAAHKAECKVLAALLAADAAAATSSPQPAGAAATAAKPAPPPVPVPLPPPCVIGGSWRTPGQPPAQLPQLWDASRPAVSYAEQCRALFAAARSYGEGAAGPRVGRSGAGLSEAYVELAGLAVACKVAAVRGLLPPPPAPPKAGHAAWEWGGLLGEALPLPGRIEPGAALTRALSRTERATAATVLWVEDVAVTLAEEADARVVGGLSRGLFSESSAAFFQDIGGLQVWAALVDRAGRAAR